MRALKFFLFGRMGWFARFGRVNTRGQRLRKLLALHGTVKRI